MIFEIKPQHIGSLSDSDLRLLVANLAEREVVKAGYSTSCVTYGGHQNARDGGVDVRVDTNGASISGYIPRSITAFQVKAADMPRSKIEREMRPKGQLRTEIKDIGKNGGAYIIASSKSRTSDNALSSRKNAMANAISDAPSAFGLFLDFYDQQRIASWVNQHPELILWVLGRIGQPLSGWRAFGDWSRFPGSKDDSYLIDEGVRLHGIQSTAEVNLDIVEGIDYLRGILAQPKGIVRIVGLSGVGKTRLVQALFDGRVGSNALSPHLAIYADLSDQPDPVPIDLLNRLQHLDQECVLIVDNCGVELHRKLVAQILPKNGFVRLVTIEYDVTDGGPEFTDVFKLEHASNSLIENLLKVRCPKLTSVEANTIAKYSEGNSSLALSLAATAEGSGSLANLSDSELFKRLFEQNRGGNSALLRAAKVCSLVYSFDGESLQGKAAELPVLASLAEQSVSELHGHIAELHRRQLVQKRAIWRAVLPHAFAHRLAKDALQEIPSETLNDHLPGGAPERLILSFSRRLGCLHDAKEASEIIHRWLGSGGWLFQIENLNKFGIGVFENIAPVNPEATLSAIDGAVKRESSIVKKEFLHRSVVIRIIRSLAYDANLFEQAITLLREFAYVADNENDRDEAVEAFRSLFFAYLSGTHATPLQRANFIRQLAKSSCPRDQMLVVKAIGAMINAGHFSSHFSFEFGTRKRDYGHNPKTRDELKEWYNTVFQLSLDLSKIPTYKHQIRSCVAQHMQQLITTTGMVDEIIALADELSRDGGWPDGWKGVSGAIRAAQIAQRSDDVTKLSALAERLSPKSYADKIQVYVLPDRWSSLDIADLYFDDDNDKYEKASARIDHICEEIGEALASDFDELVKHIPTMMESQQNRGWNVAKAVGRNASNGLAVWNIIQSVIFDPNFIGEPQAFVSGFLIGLSESKPQEAANILDLSLSHARLQPYFVNMQVSVGIDRRGFERLFAATKPGTVPTRSFSSLAGGRVCDKIPGANFGRLLIAISEREDGLETALQILHMRLYSFRSESLEIGPEDRETGRALLSQVTFKNVNQRDGHRLGEIAQLCLSSSGDFLLIDQLCRRLRDGITNFYIYASHYGDLIAALASLCPRVVLDQLVAGPQQDRTERRGLFSLLRDGRRCPLQNISDTVLLNWAMERPKERFLQLAEVIQIWVCEEGSQASDDLDATIRELSWAPIALRLVHEAPNPLAVLSVYRSRFRPSGWGGSLAEILRNRLPLLDRFFNDPDERIARWARDAKDSLETEIEEARQRESDRDRDLHERFEW